VETIARQFAESTRRIIGCCRSGASYAASAFPLLQMKGEDLDAIFGTWNLRENDQNRRKEHS
jgi:hypothetical protein